MKKITFIIIFIFIFTWGTSVSADTLFDRKSFFINSQFDSIDRIFINTTLHYVSDRAYFYVEDDYFNNMSSSLQQTFLQKVKNLGLEFDNNIQPKSNFLFGPIPNPGVDGDLRITIVLSKLRNDVGGYFDSNNENTKEQSSISNVREMLFINAETLLDNQQRLYAFLAHELQHLISFNQKDLIQGVSDDIWLNELRSEYAVTHVGYNNPFPQSNLERRAIGFVQNPSDSLTEWKNNFSDYGQIALFGQYLVDRFSPQLVAETLTTPLSGINALDYSLDKQGIKERTEVLFGDWALTNYLNDSTIDNKFSYTFSELKNLRVPPTWSWSSVLDNTEVSVHLDAKDWEARWYDLYNMVESNKGYNQLDISFISNSLSSFRLAYIVFMNDGTNEFGNIRLSNSNSVSSFPNVGSKINRIVISPYRTDRRAGFTSEEPKVGLDIVYKRVLTITNELTDSGNNIIGVKPSNYGLEEGDFIKVSGDDDVYIINNYGYRRLVLNPNICLQYGHLGKRGCFDAVKIVSLEIRDAFALSHYYTNGETKDNILYQLDITGDDTATLLQIDRELFLKNNNSNSIFFINTLEKKSY